jgi:hypothetical protein
MRNTANKLILLGAMVIGSASALGQNATAPAGAATSAAANGTPASGAAISSSLGLYVFPSKNQSDKQQTSDEANCFGWAKTRTGIDPMSVKPNVSAPQSSSNAVADAGKGAPVKGAVGGAAAGAAIGAVAGDAGKGAAIGATTGVLAGAAARRQAKNQAAANEQQQQQASSQAAAASVVQQKTEYNKAFSACMEGKGYTVK